MSTVDHILLVVHVGLAIFTLGPLTAVTMSSPRYIRAGNVAVLRYLRLMTRIYGPASLSVFLFGLFLAEGQLAKVWLSASMTLFIVALVLLVLIERDQRKALSKLSGAPPADSPSEEPGKGEAAVLDTKVEQGRIAAMSGLVALLWVVILVLMLWH